MHIADNDQKLHCHLYAERITGANLHTKTCIRWVLCFNFQTFTKINMYPGIFNWITIVEMKKDAIVFGYIKS